MRLRDVEPGDVGAYVRMRCDPVMMAELGGPQPREGMAGHFAERGVGPTASTTAVTPNMMAAIVTIHRAGRENGASGPIVTGLGSRTLPSRL
jgi:hypothetical protein